ncbi:MAG: hypothetical protein ABJP45_15075 [Cyclobacteriaceae bacterium]
MDEKSESSILDRLNRAFGPLIGAMILDLVDLATFGPLGIGGFIIGTAVGWWILSVYDIPQRTRMILAVLAGIYCLAPFTEFIPVATLVTAIARFKQSSKRKNDSRRPSEKS